MPDFPDFTIPRWDQRDWASETGESKTVFTIQTTPLDPGDSVTHTIYTVPAGKKIFFTGIVESFERRTETHGYIYGGPSIFIGFKEEFMHWIANFGPSLVFTEGLTVKYDFTNVDIISGRFSIIWTGWETAASKPEKPQNDTPEERFRVGDYNYCSKYFLPDNEVAIVFFKQKEGKRNYLRLKDHGSPKEKKLGQAKLKLDEAQEIMSTIHAEPKKVRPILEKYEKKYKLKAPKFGD